MGVETVDSTMEVEEGEDIEAEKAIMGRMYREDEMNYLKENEADAEFFRDGKQESGSGSHAKYREKASDLEKHRIKERKKERRAEMEHDSNDRERSVTHKETRDRNKDLNYHELKEKERVSSRDRRREEREEHGKKEREKEIEKEKRREKDYDQDKYRERERERDREIDKEHERGRDRGREREKGRERDRNRESERSKLQDREREKERAREKDLEREKDREKDRERERGRDKGGKDREKGKARAKDNEQDREREKEYERDKLAWEKDREKPRDKDRDKERSRERGKDRLEGGNSDRGLNKEINGVSEREFDEKLKGNIVDNYADRVNEDASYGKLRENRSDRNIDGSNGQPTPTKEIEERIMKMKEERINKDAEGASDVLAWVTKSRRLEEKKLQVERQKAQQLAKVFEEQDNIDEEDSEDERAPVHSSKDLAGVKILHGLDRVAEGGAVVLTLKDQNILADGDINEEVDMLENVEIGEQKQRDDAYKAAKKKTGVYDDKFDDDPSSRRAILPQYDDPVRDEGVTLDRSGRFTAEAEKKLEELRKRLQGSATSYQAENLTTKPGKFSSDFYTHEEMLQFKKPKKKKSLRKKNKLDLDALEAEAISTGLGATDHGTRDEAKRQSGKEEKERAEAEVRSNAYQLAIAKAEEASRALWMEQTVTIKSEQDENPVFGEDDDLYKSIEEARKLALKKQEVTVASGPQAVAALATSDNQLADDQNREDRGDKKVIFTEMNEFVWKLQLNEEIVKPEPEDNVFMDEEVAPESVEEVAEVKAGGWMEVKESGREEFSINKEVDEVLDSTIQEPVVGKGLSGVLQLLKDRGTLKETVDWGGRNMDKKKSKLVGVTDNSGQKEIRIERTDEFGRIMTPKEAFRVISHKFHGKGPGKMKLEKRMKQYHEELKLKQMKASDTPLLSMEKMREAQARMQSPYLVLSGHVKSGQSSDPRGGFGTVEKDQPGSLTPMLGDKKVEHFLGIKRKPEPSNLGPSKKPKA